MNEEQIKAICDAITFSIGVYCYIEAFEYDYVKSVIKEQCESLQNANIPSEIVDTFYLEALSLLNVSR